MSTNNLAASRQTVEHLARSIEHHDLVGLMPADIRENPRMHQLIERACETMLDERAPDELACGCAADLVRLLENIRAALRAAARELDLVREVLA